MSRAFLILALLASLTPQVRSAEKPVKIYIFAGQSNMEARYPRAFIEEKHPELLADKKIWNVQVGWPSRPIQESPAFGVDRAMVYKIAQETGQEIIDLLVELNKEDGVTVICSTHDYRMLDKSDRIFWIRDGLIEKIQNREDVKISLGTIEGE